MSAKMEYKGTDVEEAIANACAALNVAREELDIRVISTGSTGIFGFGRKKAAVQVSLKKEAGHEQKRQSADKKISPVKARPEKLAASGRKPGAVKPRPEQAANSDEPEEIAGDPVSAEDIEIIRADIARILELMGYPSELNIELDKNNKVHARITGEFAETLVGPEGQTLDSLQYVLRKIITKKFPQKVLFALDAGGFRDNRMTELQERALRLAREVKETGKTRTIPAINPAERRMVHMALQDDTEIRSRSVGDGLFKKVLIYLPGKGRRRSPRKKKSGE